MYSEDNRRNIFYCLLSHHTLDARTLWRKSSVTVANYALWKRSLLDTLVADGLLEVDTPKGGEAHYKITDKGQHHAHRKYRLSACEIQGEYAIPKPNRTSRMIGTYVATQMSPIR